MKKKILSFVLLLACVSLLASVFAINTSAANTVTMTEVNTGVAVASGDIVTVSTADELFMLAKYVSDGKTTEGITFLQTANIALPTVSNVNFSTMDPIGTATHPFKGTYDGQGFTISNVQVTRNNRTGFAALATYRAPFAYIEGATLKNVTVAIATRTAAPLTMSYIGGLVAKATDSSIIGCSVVEDKVNTTITEGAKVMGMMTGVGHVGGVVAYASNTVIDGCTSYILVQGAGRVGGIVGLAENGTVIRDCRSVGKVQNAIGSAVAAKCIGYGAVAGELKGSAVENCYASGSVDAYNKVGGVVGIADATSTVANCFSDAKVTASASGAVYGAIAGENAGALSYLYATIANRQNYLENIVLVGANTGTMADVYFYNTVENGEGYDFILGELVTNKDTHVPCSLINGVCKAENCPICHNERFVDCENCDETTMATCVTCEGAGKIACTECVHQVCDTKGYIVRDTYEFVAFDENTSITIGTKTGIRELDVALNAWITELHAENADEYAVWKVVGNTIINCMHTDFVYKPHEGKAPTCFDPGFGDKYCALCDEFIEADVVIPATGHKWNAGATCVSAQKCTVCGEENPDVPATGVHKAPIGTFACQEGVACTVCGTDIVPSQAHTRPADAFACADATCTVCGGVAKSAVAHTPAATYTCKDTTCTVCSAVILATTEHALPAGAHLCQDNVCTACGDTVRASEAHTRPEDAEPCKENVPCTVCGDNIATGARHSAGMASTCDTPQNCTTCGKELQPALGHNYQGEQNCYQGITCRVCGKYKTEIVEGVEVTYGPLGYDFCVPNKESATCTVGVYCAVCGRRMVKPLGHTLGDEATCGKGQSCTVCNTIVENATGEHTLDWTAIVVVKEATASTPAIVEVSCTSCSRVFERYLPSNTTDENGYGKIENLPLGSTVTIDVLKLSDYTSHALAATAKMLQAMRIGATTLAGDAPEGTFAVSFALNNSAVRFDAKDIKVYNLATSEEITEFTVADGFISFEAALGDYVITTTGEAYESIFPATQKPATKPTEPTEPAEPTDPADDEDGAPIGLIIGIVAAAVVVVAAVVGVVIVLSKKKKKGGASAEKVVATEDNGNEE